MTFLPIHRVQALALLYFLLPIFSLQPPEAKLGFAASRARLDFDDVILHYHKSHKLLIATDTGLLSKKQRLHKLLLAE